MWEPSWRPYCYHPCKYFYLLEIGWDHRIIGNQTLFSPAHNMFQPAGADVMTGKQRGNDSTWTGRDSPQPMLPRQEDDETGKLCSPRHDYSRARPSFPHRPRHHKEPPPPHPRHQTEPPPAASHRAPHHQTEPPLTLPQQKMTAAILLVATGNKDTSSQWRHFPYTMSTKPHPPHAAAIYRGYLS